MDWGAVFTAAIVCVLCLSTLAFELSDWDKADSKTPLRDWAVGESFDVFDRDRVVFLYGIGFATVWIGIAELVAWQWTVVIIFGALYSFGYAWGIVGAFGTVKPYLMSLKEPPRGVDRTDTFNNWVFALVGMLALFALVVVFVADVFNPLFAPVRFNIPLGDVVFGVSGYAIIGIVTTCLSFILPLRLFWVRKRALSVLIEGIDKEGPDDVAVRAAVIQHLNRGKLVTRESFPTVEPNRLRRIFNDIAHELQEATVVDRVNLTMSLRNAAAVQSVHEAFEAVRTARSEQEQRGACREIAGVLLRELGMPAPIPSPESANPVFTMSVATPGTFAAVLPGRFPVLVTALDESGVRVKDVPMALENALTQANAKSRFGIAVAAHSSQLLRNMLTRPDAGGLPQNVVYLDEDRIRAVLATRLPDIRPAFMAEVRASGVNLSVVAPFITKGPASGLMFVGRTKEMGTILQDVETRSYVILGGRRIGKTSMLHQMMLRFEQRGYATLEMDCSNAVSYDAFANLMQLHWENELGEDAQYLPARPAEDLPITFQRLVTNLTASRFKGKRLVFILDEVDLLLSEDMKREPPEQLFRGLRVLSQERHCQFIFSGERRIYEQLRNPSSPMFNFCTPIRLGLLTADEAYKLIEEPFALLYIELVEGREVSQLIADACSCHPNLIQWVCAEVVKLFGRTDIQPRISLELVSEIVARPQFRREYLDAFWGQATALEKAITVLVTHDGVTRLEEILAGLHQAGFAVTEDDFRTALEYLELYCILERTNEGISLLARHFPEYIAAEIIDRDTFLREKSAEHARR